MRIAILHSDDALEPPRDPVLDQIAEALEGAGHEAALVTSGTDVADLVARLRQVNPELVFNLSESFQDRSALDASLAALLTLLDLRYTGSSQSSLMLAGDKSLTKKILRFHDIETPGFATLYRGALDSADELRFPVIVKPPQEDASIGITTASVVHDLKELFTRIDELQAEHRSPVLVEEYVDGREFYVGVLGNAHAEALPPMEMDFSGFPEDRPRVASWDAKWGTDGAGAGAEYSGTRSVFPRDLDPALAERLGQVAVEAFRALRLRDYARVDFRLRADGTLLVIEVNPNCYLERCAEFARSAEQADISYDALIARIVELAAARYAR